MILTFTGSSCWPLHRDVQWLLRTFIKNANSAISSHVSEQTTQTHILSQACVADKTNKKGLQRHLIKQCASIKVVYTVRGQ